MSVLPLPNLPLNCRGFQRWKLKNDRGGVGNVGFPIRASAMCAAGLILVAACRVSAVWLRPEACVVTSCYCTAQRLTYTCATTWL